MTKHRLFVGVEIGEDARRAFAEIAERLQRQLPKLRFVAPENYHLTLVFLGNVAADAITFIEGELTRVVSRHQHFTLAFERLSAFPHERKPRIVYVGCRGAPRSYRDLAADAHDEMAALGYGDEKNDVPHVTLARAPERGRFTLPMLEIAQIKVTIETLTLFESIPHEGKTCYEARHRFPLVS